MSENHSPESSVDRERHGTDHHSQYAGQDRFTGFLPGVEIPTEVYRHLMDETKYAAERSGSVPDGSATPSSRDYFLENKWNQESADVPGWNSRDRIWDVYNDPVIEDLYLVFTHRSEATAAISAWFVVCLIAGLAAPVLWPHWAGLTDLACAILMILLIIIGLVYAVPKATHYDQVLKATKAIERLMTVFFVALLYIALQYYGFADACWTTAMASEAPYRAAEKLCILHIDVYSIFVQVIACVIVNVRFKAVAPVIPFYTVMLAIGRNIEPKMDSEPRFALLLVIQAVFNVMFLIILRVRSGRNRKVFEMWTQLQRNIRGFQQENALVTAQLRGMLPSDVTQKLFRGEVAFEVRPAATVSVCAIHDYVAWSYGLLPAVHFKTIDFLFCAFDSTIAARTTINKWKAIGDRYISGTTSAPVEPETAARSPSAELMRFAFYQVRTAERLSHLRRCGMKVCVGVNTGPCCTGIIGTTSLWYEVVGEAVNAATSIAHAADAGQVFLTRSALATKGAGAVCAVSTDTPHLFPHGTKDIECFPATMLFQKKQAVAILERDMSQEEASEDLPPSAVVVEDEATPEEKERLDRERFAILQDRAGIDNTRRGLELRSIQEQIDKDMVRFSSAIPRPMRFTDPEVEAEYGHYAPENSGPEVSAMPFAIGFVGMMLVIATAENSLTLPAAIALGGDLFLLAAWAKARKHDVKLPEPLVALVVYSLPVLATAYLQESTLGTFRLYLCLVLPILVSEHLVASPWLISCGVSVVIIVLTFALDLLDSYILYGLQQIFSYIIWAVFMFYHTFTMERKRRLNFRDSLVSGAYGEALKGEIELQRAIQDMIVPPSLARYFSAKQRRETSGLIDAGELCTARVRVEGFAENLTLMVETPSAALASMEALYGLVERFLQDRDRIVEKLQTMGDEITLAGPLRYQKRQITINDASKPYGAVPPKTVKDQPVAIFEQPEEQVGDSDRLLSAAFTLLDLMLELRSLQSNCSITAVCDSGLAFAALVGELRPAFGVVGPVMQSLDAIFKAAPPNSRQVSSHFRRVLMDRHVPLPRREGDFRFGAQQRWRLRGRGMATVIPLLNDSELPASL